MVHCHYKCFHCYIILFVDICRYAVIVVDIVALLLESGAPIKVKNSLGWSPMSEAVSYGDRQISMFPSLPFSELIYFLNMAATGLPLHEASK